MSLAVLFDLDGTLTDPKPGITGCISYALEKLGHPPSSADELEWCIGPPLAGSFPRLLDTNDPALIERAIELYRERFATVGLFENTVYREIPKCLEALREDGIRLYVATSKPQVYAQKILDHFELSHYFTKIYGSELDGTRSNKEDLIAYILEMEDLDSLKTLMVGDREHDVLGAQKNGVACIGVRYGYGSRRELWDAGAVTVCDDPMAIVRMIRRFITSGAITWEPPVGSDELPEVLLQEREILIQEIYEAFEGVTRDGGVSWREADVLDCYGTEEECLAARARDKDTTWQSLVHDAAWDEETGIGGWAFLDPIGYRYYIPAAMVRGTQSGECCLEFWFQLYDEHTLSKFSLLDDRQRQCVARFVHHMHQIEEGTEPYYRDSGWFTALNSYWKNYLPPSERPSGK